MNRKNKLRCNECGAVFREDDVIFTWENAFVCSDCFDELCRELSPIERANAMGCEVRLYNEFIF